jgi:hypothetical protein
VLVYVKAYAIHLQIAGNSLRFEYEIITGKACDFLFVSSLTKRSVTISNIGQSATKVLFVDQSTKRAAAQRLNGGGGNPKI